MDTNFFKSKTFRGILYGIGIFAVLLVVFNAGMFVGFKRAQFSLEWGANYERNFAGPNGGGMMGDFQGDKFVKGHGVIGQIIKIDLPQILIKGINEQEKSVIVGSSTQIRQFQGQITSGDLKIDQTAVVVGTPNKNGEIEAKLIRILPEPPFAPTGTKAF